MRAFNAAQMVVMRALKDEFAEAEVRGALKETQLEAESFDAIDRSLPILRDIASSIGT